MNETIKKLYSMTYGHPLIQTPFGHKYIINADCIASGFPNQHIENIINTQVLPYYANTHSNAYSGRLMSYHIEQSKLSIRQALNAKDTDRLIFTGNGCTGAVMHLIHSLNFHAYTPETAVVFMSKAEHHSILLPFKHLPITVVYLPLLPNGLIDLKFFESQLKRYQNYKLIVACLNASSNVTGVHQKTHILSQLVHKYKGYICFDFAASAPYIPINLHYDDAKQQYYDAIFISTHKFFGGPGTPGLLIANDKMFKNEVPFCPGGGTVRFVCQKFQTYNPNIEVKETGGTPDILGSIKSGLAFDLKQQYQQFITSRDQQLTYFIQSELLKIPNLKLLNPIDNLDRMPIFVFMIPPLHYNLIVVILNDVFGIQTRGGISCCSLLAQDLLKLDDTKQQHIYQQIVNNKGVPANYGWCRFACHYSMPDFLVEYIINSIALIAQFGQLFQKLYKYYPNKNNWLYCPQGCPFNDFAKSKLRLDQSPRKLEIKYLTKTILDQQLTQAENIIKKIAI